MRTIINITVAILVVFAVSLLPLTAQNNAGIIKCTLKGEVIDRPQSSKLLLIKSGKDPRTSALNILINDGKFEYDLNCEYEEKYELIFNDEVEKGAFRSVSFFSESGVIKFILYPTDRYNENKIDGGKLTREYLDYFKQISTKQDKTEHEFISKSKQYLEDNYGELLSKHETLEDDDLKATVELLEKDGVDIEPVIQAITEIEDSLYREANQEIEHFPLQYIKEHPGIVGYSILLSEASSKIQRNRIFQETNDISPYIDLYYKVFEPKFPSHPYTARMEALFAGAAIKAGVPFVDFTAVDLDENPVRLSELIAGKPTILNLWASWCGPCRRKGKELIPIYEEFQDKGLIIIGVARETTISAAETAIKTDKYPWKNLVELNDTKKIWMKYGIGNSGGMVFLIDENGIIVSSNPTVEEIRDFLEKKQI